MWNARGINSQSKWDAIRDTISESAASVILQEIKRSSFDQFYLSKFCPRQMNKFEYSVSDGVSGGLVTIWNESLFLLTGRSFHLTNIYGPCAADEKAAFIWWLYNFDTNAIDD